MWLPVLDTELIMTRKPFVPYSKPNKSGVSRIVRDNYGPNWFSICKEVRARDKGLCGFCGKPESRKDGVYHDVHHLRRLADGGRTVLSNLILCCDSCHEKRPRHQHMKNSGDRKKSSSSKTSGWGTKKAAPVRYKGKF